jgi:phytoene dehydrogenase-like protein
MKKPAPEAPATAVVIVGGGLSGLAAAVQLGRFGVPTIVFDQANDLGGRAMTEVRNGFYLNCGPHRLYERGAAVKALRELGIEIDGAPRGPNGGFAVWRGRKYTMPVGPCSLLTTGLFGACAKREVGRLMSALPALGLDTLQQISIAEWVRRHLRDPNVIELVLALVRYTTYSDDLDRLSASAALEQLRLSVSSAVLYVHNGWGTLVRTLQRAAVSTGTEIVSGRRVVSVSVVDGLAAGVTLEDGALVRSSAVIVATGPQAARRLVAGAAELETPADAIRVAALDVALSRLPDERAVFAVGVDESWCFSADSAIARVAPESGAVVHLAKYLRAGTPGTPADERQLERALDLLQPGWRESVVYRRFLPAVVVSHALVSAATGGFTGRHSGRLPGIANVFLAGDWVGPTGQLADACVASGLEAARRAAQILSFESEHYGSH